MIYSYSKPNFCAKPINTYKVCRFNDKLNKFTKTDAHFVLLENRNAEDLNAVEDCAKNWKTDFAKVISTSFHWNAMKKIEYNKIYALTLQKDNFEILNPTEILGLANVTEQNSKKMFLEYLQINPEAININQKTKKFKGCGTAMIKSFQNIYNVIHLNSSSLEEVMRFYRKNGFIKSLFSEFEFVWKNNLLFKLWKLVASCLYSHPVD